MEKITFEYEISLQQSIKENMVVVLKIVCNWKERLYYWKWALMKVKRNVYIFWKETHKYITELKLKTDEIYLASKK